MRALTFLSRDAWDPTSGAKQPARNSTFCRFFTGGAALRNLTATGPGLKMWLCKSGTEDL